MSANTSMRLNHAQAAKVIKHQGATNTFLLRGRPGIGKSALLNEVASQLDYKPVMLDCALLEPGDLAVPNLNHETGTVSYYVNENLGFGGDTPVVVCLDEFGKANPAVMTALLPLVYERRVFGRRLPEGSIVFATSNLDTDGVGDRIEAHAYDRMTVVELGGPLAEEWQKWAVGQGIAGEILTFAHTVGQIFDDYRDANTDGNPYIFNPKVGQVTKFVTPRGLELASPTVAAFKSGAYDADTALAVLAGQLGPAGATTLHQLLILGADVPSPNEVLADPSKTIAWLNNPDTPLNAQFILATSLVSAATSDTAMDTFCGVLDAGPQREALLLFVTLASAAAHASRYLMRPGSQAAKVLSAVTQQLTGL